MRIGIIGINHKSAELRLREKFAKACQRRFASNGSAHAQLSYVLLSTCNRTEVYFSSEDLAASHTYLLGILRNDIVEEFEHKLYSYFGSDCFFHLARVTSGMDSAMIGETEIQGQVKHAYESVLPYQLLSKELHFLFQKCLKIGKEVRSTLAFSQGMPTLEGSILTAANCHLGNLASRSILFVGVSEINEKIYRRFSNQGLNNITFCNRTLERVEAFAKKHPVSILPWEKKWAWPNFDLLIFGTKASHYVMTSQLLEGFASGTPKMVIDLCVPRNVDPSVGKHHGIALLNVDQINKVIDRKQKLKAAEYARIEAKLIVNAVKRQVGLFQERTFLRQEFALTQAS